MTLVSGIVLGAILGLLVGIPAGMIYEDFKDVIKIKDRNRSKELEK